VFSLSTPSFYLDVKVNEFYNDRMATEMGPQFDQCMLALNICADTDRRPSPIRTWWYRFESRALARAIGDYHQNPPAPHVLPFLHYLKPIGKEQGIKFNSGPSRRTDYFNEPRHQLQNLHRDRFEALFNDSMETVRIALGSVRDV
jgi:hypothetical protein